MFVFLETPHTRLGSRRLGGPIPFRDLWTTLKVDLAAVSLATSEPAELDAVRAATKAELEGTSSASFSTAA